eukprot:2328535-Pleurochrysis_carterae.AAC.1
MVYEAFGQQTVSASRWSTKLQALKLNLQQGGCRNRGLSLQTVVLKFMQFVLDIPAINYES